MTNSYSETQKSISDTIINEVDISQFESMNVSDNEYYFAPLDHNFLQVKSIFWEADGLTNTISLGTTLNSSNQILYVCAVERAGDLGGCLLLPDAYSLNGAKNAIVLRFTPTTEKKFYIKILDGKFFTGVQGGSNGGNS